MLGTVPEHAEPADPGCVPANWPRPDPPVEDVVGQAVEHVVRRYEAGGFQVRVVDLGTDWAVEHDLRPGRITVYHRDGRVESADHG